jgi:hypothetical protein
MQGQTVQIRIQVIDLHPQILDLRVPTYLKSADLSQRIARDAGLQAFWPNRQRRLYWLRARGRLLQDGESLGELGVIDNELVYLLPQPPQEMGVVEQDPDYPEVHSYAGKGWLILVSSVFGVMLWSMGWGLALSASQHWTVAILPSLGMGVMCTGFARHAWGGRASRIRVCATALLLYTLALVPSFLVPLLVGSLDFKAFLNACSPGIVTGMAGVLLAWLAWGGAVEPLPPRRVKQILEVESTAHTCGICAQSVDQDVEMVCSYQCGRIFHQGCHAAKVAVYRGQPGFCEICNQLLM